MSPASTSSLREGKAGPSGPTQHSAPPTGAPATFNPFNLAQLKDGLKKYGRTGVAVYLVISLSVTTGWYIAIERSVDVKKLLGIKENPDKEPTWIERVVVGKGSNVALAIVASKFCVPVKVPVAMALTPYVQRCAYLCALGQVAGTHFAGLGDWEAIMKTPCTWYASRKTSAQE